MLLSLDSNTLCYGMIFLTVWSIAFGWFVYRIVAKILDNHNHMQRMNQYASIFGEHKSMLSDCGRNMRELISQVESHVATAYFMQSFYPYVEKLLPTITCGLNVFKSVATFLWNTPQNEPMSFTGHTCPTVMPMRATRKPTHRKKHMRTHHSKSVKNIKQCRPIKQNILIEKQQDVIDVSHLFKGYVTFSDLVKNKDTVEPTKESHIDINSFYPPHDVSTNDVKPKQIHIMDLENEGIRVYAPCYDDDDLYNPVTLDNVSHPETTVESLANDNTMALEDDNSNPIELQNDNSCFNDFRAVFNTAILFDDPTDRQSMIDYHELSISDAREIMRMAIITLGLNTMTTLETINLEAFAIPNQTISNLLRLLYFVNVGKEQFIHDFNEWCHENSEYEASANTMTTNQ